MKLADRSLRTRLLAELLALLAAACLLIGVLTEFALHSFLIGQMDDRLASASRRLLPPEGPPPDGRPPPGGRPPPDNGQPPPGGDRPRPPPLDGAGTEVGTLSAVVEDGRVVEANYLDGASSTPTAQAIPSEFWDELLAVRPGDRPKSMSFGPLGEYRVLAAAGPQPGETAIVGLPMAEVNATMLQVGLIITGVALAALAVTGAAGAVIVRITLRPLRRVAETASRVAELPLDRGEVALSVRVPAQDTNPHTEVGKVGNALNRMLGHVGEALAARQASETRVRQFVADASHELRTPLAAIRGYAELTRRGGHQVPPDVAHAMRRVESESVRMTALVDDLLLLARLDAAAAAAGSGGSGTGGVAVAGMGASGASRALASAAVDLSMLVVDAASDAHVAGPEHRWRLGLPADSVVVTGDEAQLHHVLGNLLANARTHTPPGTTVTVRLAATDGHAVLTVTDDGPGIPASLLPEVFDRFARGDSSRSRKAGSTGLGLAIVTAVVQAHAGTVEAASRPGETVFTVRLPLTTPGVPAGTPADGNVASAAPLDEVTLTDTPLNR